MTHQIRFIHVALCLIVLIQPALAQIDDEMINSLIESLDDFQSVLTR